MFAGIPVNVFVRGHIVTDRNAAHEKRVRVGRG